MIVAIAAQRYLGNPAADQAVVQCRQPTRFSILVQISPRSVAARASARLEGH